MNAILHCARCGSWAEFRTDGAKGRPRPADGNMRTDALDKWQALGAAGITVSVCFGPSKGRLLWTVQAMNAEGDEFERPFVARSPEHALEIAVKEAWLNGWIRELL